MKIKAAVVEAPGAFSMRDVELDAPRADEILVEIRAAGVCHTDIVAQQGGFGYALPAVLGHEGAGIVRAIGSAVKRVKPGDRVAISFRSCGDCTQCNGGHPAYCDSMGPLNFAGARPDGTAAIHVAGGPLISNFFGQSSFATHALTYERNVVKLADDIPFEIAAPLGCGIQTGAGSVFNVFRCSPGSSLMVLGGGAVGLAAVMAGRIAQCATIMVVEPVAARREMALSLGATHVIDPAARPDLAVAARAIVASGLDFILDTTGRDDVLAEAMDALGTRGALGCVGIAAPGTRIPGNLMRLVSLGQRIEGIIEGDSDPALMIPKLIDHYRSGDLPLDRIVSVYPFQRINEAIADQHAGRCIKIVMTFE